MIIMEQKPFEEILSFLKDEKSIFIVGCAQCATVCKVGGEEEVKAMNDKLESQGKKVRGWVVIDPACQSVEVKKNFQANKDKITSSDAILVMACGNGVQSVKDSAERIKMEKPVHPACNPLFLGEVVRAGYFEEKCSLCGDCLLEVTGGICPVTRCSKGLLNGPCGGSSEGKCEVDPERDCGWALIYEELKKRGKLDRMKAIQPAKDHSKLIKPRTLTLGS
jgi:ferredoxin